MADTDNEEPVEARAAEAVAPEGIEGSQQPDQIEAGNIDLFNRQPVQNDDGSISTVRSMSFGTDKGETLVPTVGDGRVLSNDEAMDRYEQTGENLGTFRTEDAATGYAQWLHGQQESLYSPPIDAEDAKVQARLHGYGWDEINGFIEGAENLAKSAWGYTQKEVNSFLGYNDSQPTTDRLQSDVQVAIADQQNPDIETKPPASPGQDELPDAVREAYYKAKVKGEVKSPQDFAQKYTDATLTALGDETGYVASPQAAQAATNMAKLLPDDNDLTDRAIAIVHASELPVTPENIATAKDNLLSRWVDTGYTPEQSYNQAQQDSDLANNLANPRKLVEPPSNDPSLFKSTDTVWDGEKYVSGPGMFGRIWDETRKAAAFPFQEMPELDLKAWGMTEEDFQKHSPGASILALKKAGYTTVAAVDLTFRGIMGAVMGGAAGAMQFVNEEAQLHGIPMYQPIGGTAIPAADEPQVPIRIIPTGDVVIRGIDYEKPLSRETDVAAGRTEHDYEPPAGGFKYQQQVEPVLDPLTFAFGAATLMQFVAPELVPEGMAVRAIKAATPPPPRDLFPHGIPTKITKDPAMVEHLPDDIKEYFGLKDRVKQFATGESPFEKTKPEVAIEDITIDGESGPPLRTTMTPEEEAAAHFDSLAAQAVQEHFGGKGIVGSFHDLLWVEQGAMPLKVPFKLAYKAMKEDSRVEYDKLDSEAIGLQNKENLNNADAIRLMQISDRQKALLEGREDNPEGVPPAPTNAPASEQIKTAIKLSRRQKRLSELMRQDFEDQEARNAKVNEAADNAEQRSKEEAAADQTKHQANVASEHEVDQRNEIADQAEWGKPRKISFKEAYDTLSDEDKTRVDTLDAEHQKIMAAKEITPENGQRLTEIQNESDKIIGERTMQLRKVDEERLADEQQTSAKLKAAHDQQQARNEKMDLGADIEKNREIRAEEKEQANQRSAADLKEDERGEVRRPKNYQERYNELDDNMKVKVDDLQAEHRKILQSDTISEAQGRRLRDINDQIDNLTGKNIPEREAGEFTKRAEAIAKDEADRERIVRKTEQHLDEKAENERLAEEQRQAAFDYAVQEGRPGWLNRLMTSPWRGAEARAQAFAKRFYANEVAARIRQARGLSNREYELARARMEEYRDKIKPLIPEHQAWIKYAHTNPEEALKNPSRIQQLINHVEGVDRTRLAETDNLFKFAEGLRDEYQNMRADIEAHFPDFSNIFDDYYRHLWENPKKLDQHLGFGKQGSGASLKERTWMTMAEGIARGGVPKILDPIDNILHYMQGMRDFLAAHEIIQDGKDRGIIYYASSARDANDIQLKGRAAQIGTKDGGILYAYANGGYAKRYNSWVGRGFYDWGKDYGFPIGDIFEKLRAASSMMTGLKLSLSAFHALNIAQETIVAGLAKGLGQVAYGALAFDLKEMGYGFGELLLSSTVAPKLVAQWYKGRRLQKIYNGTLDKAGITKFLTGGAVTPEENQLVSYLVQANTHFMGRGKEYYVGRPSENIRQAVKRGVYRAELYEGMKKIAGETDEAFVKRLVASPFRAVGYFAHELISRPLNTAMAPLFDHFIPHIKIAAAADELSLWMRTHPTASTADRMAMARRVSDTMDDRFGEMVQDNLFWPRALKQFLNAATVSIGWEYGTLRAFGGATHDLLHGDVLSPRARWLVAFPAVYAAQNSAYQYLKTGQFPWQTDTPWSDALMGGRTGGITPEGQPERGRLPSVAKDIWNAYNIFHRPVASGDVRQIIGAAGTWTMQKGNPAVQFTRGAIMGTNQYGNELSKPDPKQGLFDMYWKRFTETVMGDDNILPISINALMKRKIGSKITRAEDLLGISPEGQQYTNPEGVKAAQDKHDLTVRRTNASRALKQEMQYENPNLDKINELQEELQNVKDEMRQFNKAGSGRISDSGGGGGSGGGGSGGGGRSSGGSSRGSRSGGDYSEAAYNSSASSFDGGVVLRGGGGGSDAAAAVSGGSRSSGGKGSRTIPRGNAPRGTTNRGRRRVRAG